jgi:hypothetical protein
LGARAVQSNLSVQNGLALRHGWTRALSKLTSCELKMFLRLP